MTTLPRGFCFSGCLSVILHKRNLKVGRIVEHQDALRSTIQKMWVVAENREIDNFLFSKFHKNHFFADFFFFVATTLKVMRFSQACAPSLSASFDV